ncbi:MAG: hypothetical protein RBS17_11770, partial [Coriobacteriia bacterium]|nr:hypothetical protein [Coriobacteriia bacterium]
MSGRRFANATAGQLERLVRTLLAARVFPDEDTLRAVLRARPWAVQVNDRGDVAVLDRWRDHLDVIAIEALWCPHRHLARAIADIESCAVEHGFSGIVSPPVLEADVPFYRAAGLEVREMLEILELGSGSLGGADRPRDICIRTASPADLPTILEVDAACFEPFWRYDLRHLQWFCAAGD